MRKQLIVAALAALVAFTAFVAPASAGGESFTDLYVEAHNRLERVEGGQAQSDAVKAELDKVSAIIGKLDVQLADMKASKTKTEATKLRDQLAKRRDAQLAQLAKKGKGTKKPTMARSMAKSVERPTPAPTTTRGAPKPSGAKESYDERLSRVLREARELEDDSKTPEPDRAKRREERLNRLLREVEELKREKREGVRRSERRVPATAYTASSHRLVPSVRNEIVVSTVSIPGNKANEVSIIRLTNSMVAKPGGIACVMVEGRQLSVRGDGFYEKFNVDGNYLTCAAPGTYAMYLYGVRPGEDIRVRFAQPDGYVSTTTNRAARYKTNKVKLYRPNQIPARFWAEGGY